MTGNDDDNEVIQQLYELVSAPSGYDQFMELFEERLDGIVDRHATKPAGASALVGHLKRAAELLDVVSPWPLDPSTELRDVLSTTMQAALAIDADGQLVDRNETADLVYGFSAAPSYLELPLDERGRALFLSAVRQTISGIATSNSPNDVRRLQNAVTGRSVLITMEPFQAA